MYGCRGGGSKLEAQAADQQREAAPGHQQAAKGAPHWLSFIGGQEGLQVGPEASSHGQVQQAEGEHDAGAPPGTVVEGGQEGS